MITLKNRELTVSLAERGAEPCRIYDNVTGRDYLWLGTTEGLWRDHSPVLFPVVGIFGQGDYTVRGEKYTLPIHGFAGSSVFDAEQRSEEEAVFTLKSTSETLKKYPFPFTFCVSYCLHDCRLETTYTVTNDGDEDMYYEIGSHGGFIMEGAMTDWRLRFENAENRDNYTLQCNDCRLQAAKPLSGTDFPLLPSYFDMGCLTFGSLSSRVFTLESDRHPYRIRFELGSFPYLSLWQQPGAPYLCLEPWSCASAHYAVSNALEKQPGVTRLAPGQSHTDRYAVSMLRA